MPDGQPAHTMRNELGSLQRHECAHRVAHHLTLTIAGGFAGVEIVRLDRPPSNRTCTWRMTGYLTSLDSGHMRTFRAGTTADGLSALANKYRRRTTGDLIGRGRLDDEIALACRGHTANRH